MGDRRASLRALAGAVTFAGALTLAAACGGQSNNPVQQYQTSQLDCLVTLQSYCCASVQTPTCVPSFSAASQCSAWSAKSTVQVYPAACQGLTAVRVTEAYSTFYVYDASGALYAVGDNATTTDPRSGVIACGAGPGAFVIPTACADIWLGTTGAAACTSGTATVASICH